MSSINAESFFTFVSYALIKWDMFSLLFSDNVLNLGQVLGFVILFLYILI